LAAAAAWQAVYVALALGAAAGAARMAGTGAWARLLAMAAPAALCAAWLWASPLAARDPGLREAFRDALRERPWTWSLACAAGAIPLARAAVRGAGRRRRPPDRTGPAGPEDEDVARRLLEGMAARAPETVRGALARQVEAVTSLRLHWTGAGFFAEIRMNRFRCSPLPPASLPLSRPARSPALRRPLQVTLFARDGFITLLEGVARGEEYPPTLAGLELTARRGTGRVAGGAA